MAFNLDGLRRMMNAGHIGADAGSVRSIYSYVTNDAPAAVEASNYFNGNKFTKGDIIIAAMTLGGTPVGKCYIVTSATDAATVTVAAFTYA